MGRVAVITGASRGIGAATALVLAEQGFGVVVNYRSSAEQADEVVHAATAVLGWLRRQLVVLPAFTTGVLLICDAWFDILTASPRGIWVSVLTAALGNLRLAVIMITGAVRILPLTATRLWFLDPGTPAWRLP